jgi:hypothetical protein
MQKPAPFCLKLGHFSRYRRQVCQFRELKSEPVLMICGMLNAVFQTLAGFASPAKLPPRDGSPVDFAG